MTIAPGTRLGGYEITAKLGEGGMGEVYRATDTKLRREVAIKVLPAAFTEDPERLARFEREAQLLAQLHHPNIASIFGLEESEGVRALVMELVEGPTLADRLAQGALPLDESLSIAKQIAEALEEAHDKGIVHRDLKPQNIKASIEGKVKVLDFGLAKAMDPAAAAGSVAVSGDLLRSPTLMNSPTLTAVHGTQLGVILGTAAYMAPEQARGGAVDKRADIWAFGVVLYEMLVGRSPFAAKTVSDTLAGVLRGEIDFDRLPPETPVALRRLLRRCLERNPKERLRDIGEARIELALFADGRGAEAVASPSSPAPRGVRTRELAAWTALAVASVAALFFALRGSGSGEETAPRRPVRLAFVPPDGVTADEGAYDVAVVSPDGRHLVFTGRATGERRRLWVRSFDALEARALPGTEDAIEPFWSPDSRALAFGAGGKLKRVDLVGGGAQAIGDAPRLTGGAWGRDGTIVYSPDFNASLYRLPATGGARTLLRRPDPAAGELGLNNPALLPDGRFAFRVNLVGGRWSYRVAAPDSASASTLIEDVTQARLASPDWLLYTRNEALYAQRLDPLSLAPRGEPILLATGQRSGATFNSSAISVSDNGVLVLRAPRGYRYRLLWIGRDGRRLSAAGEARVVVAGNPEGPRLSPDGRQLLVQRFDPATRNQDIWTIDLGRGSELRLTTDPAYDQLPLWSPDGESVYFSRAGGVYRLPARGGSEERILDGTFFTRDVAPDGSHLILGHRGETTSADLWALALAGQAEPFPLLTDPFSELEARLSPDGRWLAYNSDLSGRDEVYVRPISADWKLGTATRISVGGGLHPRWRRDGLELFFVSAPASLLEATMMSVPVRAEGERFLAGAPVALFPVAIFPNAPSTEYDVSADGSRFLVGTVEGPTSASAVTVVFDWNAGLEP